MELQPNSMVAAVAYVNGGAKMDSYARDAIQVSQPDEVGSTHRVQGRALSLATQQQR